MSARKKGFNYEVRKKVFIYEIVNQELISWYARSPDEDIDKEINDLMALFYGDKPPKDVMAAECGIYAFLVWERPLLFFAEEEKDRPLIERFEAFIAQHMGVLGVDILKVVDYVDVIEKGAIV